MRTCDAKGIFPNWLHGLQWDALTNHVTAECEYVFYTCIFGISITLSNTCLMRCLYTL